MESHSGGVRYTGGETANVDYHHGMLKPVLGVSHFQVLRANRSRFHWSDGFGWTYNHAPMLAYWNRRFYLQYLSNPSGEHVPPGQSFLMTSEDGVQWDFPRQVFPFYQIPPGVYASPDDIPLSDPAYAVMHQRMGFYTAPSGRLLTLGFYGICSTTMDYPNTGNGIGRVVREVFEDGSFGPIYFIRLNRHAGWDESNTNFPLYTESADTGFVEACEALLADRLATLQWWEEDRSPDGFYAVEGGKALSWFTLADGRVVALWKHSLTAMSKDGGASWSPMRKEPSLIMAGGKAWGQRTPDGRYVIVYNPTPDNVHRWPLALVSSDDGLTFDRLRLVAGKVSPRRYQGGHKDLGMNYVRGITEGNGMPPGDALWVTWSMNKEDIWISRIPTPLRDRVETPVDDCFDDFKPGRLVPDWNLHCGVWAYAEVVSIEGDGRWLRLFDKDKAETAQAERIFTESREVEVRFAVRPGQDAGGCLHVDLLNPEGLSGMWIHFDPDGWIRIRAGAEEFPLDRYRGGEQVEVALQLDAVNQRYTLELSGGRQWEDCFLVRPVLSFARIRFRTGREFSDESLSLESTRKPHEDELPFSSINGADDPASPAFFDLKYLRTVHPQPTESASQPAAPSSLAETPR